MDKSKALQKTSLGGSILAAITASLCCIGPLAAVALGAGGFAASAVFEKWRPAFLGLTLVLLALAWYLTYRKPKAGCEEGSVCATRPAARWNKIFLWFATVFVLVTAAFPSLSSAMFRGSQRPTPAVVADPNSSILKMQIPGMDCRACAASIQAMLQKQAGVQTARVNFDTKEAVVQYDVRKLSPEKIITTIDATGFKAKPTVQR